MTKNTRLTRDDLAADLDELTKLGIQADRAQLKQDMCSQFADYREWIREYAVNAYDARARHFYVSGREDGETLTITVEDDGHGMDREGVSHFLTIYRSVKQRSSKTVVGSHGIGKLSVAAIPGQTGFSMTTSTGREAWTIETGSLLQDIPIRLEPVLPVPPQGTRFDITFKKEKSIDEELSILADILEKFLKYLPIKICVFELDRDENSTPESARIIRTLYGHWEVRDNRFSRIYSFRLKGNDYNAVMGLGPEVHEIYQNHVLVSASYNLLFFDQQAGPRIPGITIRVNSPDFRLPFGRHCLMNEEVLGPLSAYLRKNILTQFTRELFDLYEMGTANQFDIRPEEIQDLACAMIQMDNRLFSRATGLAVFNLMSRPRISLDDLRRSTRQAGVLYLENKNGSGMDYTVFDGPVLSLKQPLNGLELLKKQFEDRIIDLATEEVLVSSPGKSGPRLNASEKKLKAFLGFHPDLVKNIKSSLSGSKSGPDRTSSIFLKKDSPLAKGLKKESEQADKDLSAIEWQVDHLVLRDGKTPCKSHRFIIKKNTVVLNLYHPEVMELVRLAEKAPALSGHYALIMCLVEDNTLLPYLRPEAREELIHLDAITRCGETAFAGSLPDPEEWTLDEDELNEFMLDLEDTRKWLK